MRDLDIAKAKHENILYATEDDFCWAEFIAAEERIRSVDRQSMLRSY